MTYYVRKSVFLREPYRAVDVIGPCAAAPADVVLLAEDGEVWANIRYVGPFKKRRNAEDRAANIRGSWTPNRLRACT